MTDRWHRNDPIIREVAGREAAEETPLHSLPWLVVAAVTLLGVAWLLRHLRQAENGRDTEHFGGEPMGRSA